MTFDFNFYVNRMQNDRWARVSTQWVSEGGRRRRDRPKKRWRDDMDVHCGGWFEVALEKSTWKDMGEAFVQQ